MGRTAYGGRGTVRVELTPRLADGERLERRERARRQTRRETGARQVPRRHRNAGNRPRGPQPLDALRRQLGLPSDSVASMARTHTASADETAGRDVVGHRASEIRRDADEALDRPRRRSTAIARTGSRPVNDRHTEVRPQSRTARVHPPVIDLGEDVVYVAQGLVRVRRERLEQLR